MRWKEFILIMKAQWEANDEASKVDEIIVTVLTTLSHNLPQL